MHYAIILPLRVGIVSRTVEKALQRLQCGAHEVEFRGLVLQQVCIELSSLTSMITSITTTTYRSIG